MMSVATPRDKFPLGNIFKTLLILCLVLYLMTFSLHKLPPNSSFLSCLTTKELSESIFVQENSIDSPTNVTNLVFGLFGSEAGWHYRKAYIESWWRPNITRGYIYLDAPPTGELLPWSNASPTLRVSKDLSNFLDEIKSTALTIFRIIHGIMEVFEEEKDNENFRWLIIGDDDSIFFVDNIVDVLAKYDHTKYYYIGASSEFTYSNFAFSFDQGFGGAGIILSYSLGQALARDMDSCLRRYASLAETNPSDYIIKLCIADIGVDLSPEKGLHQIDLRGNLSGFLSSHTKSPLMSLHHFDMVDPIFPSMDRLDATRHLMKAAELDQSRMLQQTICHHRESNWTFAISWGYSVHVYERIMPRSHLQKPIETFQNWLWHTEPPHFMFNTRLPSDDPCEAPHIFYFESIEKTLEDHEILTSYSRRMARGLPVCELGGGHPADFVTKIHVFSSPTKRNEMDRCECCDIVGLKNSTAVIEIRECLIRETIA